MSTALASSITLTEIREASKAIAPFLKETPILTLAAFNSFFGHDVAFKLENLQETGAFKIRGVINVLTNLKKRKIVPQKVVTYGTGNHGIALAWASKFFGIEEVKIYLPACTSETKKRMASEYGAKVVITPTREEAESRAQVDSRKVNCCLIPPSDNDDVISGAATVVYEVLQKKKDIDSIFVPIGGGSLSSGTILAKNYISSKIQVYAGEPQQANDASISYNTGDIFRFKETPKTIADGATALGLTRRVFNYIKDLDGIYEISEKEIAYWTMQFLNLSGVICEPTSALAIAAAYRWAKEMGGTTRKKILIVITGGNVSIETQKAIFSDDLLKISPDKIILND